MLFIQYRVQILYFSFSLFKFLTFFSHRVAYLYKNKFIYNYKCLQLPFWSIDIYATSLSVLQAIGGNSLPTNLLLYTNNKISNVRGEFPDNIL